MPGKNYGKYNPETKPLTRKERLYVEGIALNGLNKEEAYSVAFDMPRPTAGEELRLFTQRATLLFYKPHIRYTYDALMEKVREQETKKAAWTKEVSTQKLMNLVDKAEAELNADRITMARLTAMTTAIKELNTMHGLNAPTKMEIEGGMSITIIEDKLED